MARNDDRFLVRSFAGPEYADCRNCDFADGCLGVRGRYVAGIHPEDWAPGGIMFITDPPSKMDLSYGAPLRDGNASRRFGQILAAVGVPRESAWITSCVMHAADDSKATEGASKKDRFSERFPRAQISCLSRLETEIQKARPRVIVTLGRTAFQSLVADIQVKRKQVTNPCSNARCSDAWGRKEGPVLACHKGDCDWEVMADQDVFREGWEEMQAAPDVYRGAAKPPAWLAWGESVLAPLVDPERPTKGARCPKCDARVRNMPRLVKCRTCGGTKTKALDVEYLADNYPLIGREGAAGAVFPAEQFDLAQYGVKYVVPTYSLPFVLQTIATSGGGKKKGIGGQFAARAMAEHIRRAYELLTRDFAWRDPDVITVTPDRPGSLEVARAWLREPGRYAADIETNSWDGPEAVTSISCIGFARADRTSARRPSVSPIRRAVSLVIDTRRVYPKPPPATDDPDNLRAWRPMDAAEAAYADDVLDLLEEFFSREDVELVWHNGNYDRYTMHLMWDLWTYNTRGDTMAAHNVCYPDEEHGLGFVAHELIDAPYWKADGHTKPATGQTHNLSGYQSFEALALYNARDNLATALVDEVLVGPPGGRGRLHEDGVLRAYEDDIYNYDLGLRMTLAGIAISTSVRSELRADFVSQLGVLKQEMRHVVGRSTWEPTGEGQRWAFFDPMGPCRFFVEKVGKDGRPSIAKDVLKPHYGEHPLVGLMLRYRTLEYYLSHFVDSKDLRLDQYSRLHPIWAPKLVTGRWAVTPNIHAWPKGSEKNPELNMRRMVVAPRGRRLVSIDYSQLELRIMAALSNDAALIELIANADESDKLNPDKDPHSYLARAVFKSAYVNAAKGEKKVLRDCVKRVWYGSLYGGGATTIMNSLLDADYEGPPLTVPFIESVLRMIGEVFPGTARWREEQIRNLYRNGEVQTPYSGRHRVFFFNEAEATIAQNFPIQASAADIVNWRVRLLDQELEGTDPTAQIIIQHHDSVTIECDEDRTDAIKRLAEDVLQIRWQIPGTNHPMAYSATAEDGASWDQT